MAFATGANVMKAVESIMIKLCRHLTLNYRIENYDGELVTVHQDKASAAASPFWPFKKNGESFPHITYEEAMSKHGSDKPDLRIPFQVSTTTSYG
jgi:aspartyl-tRNA synthetase